MKQPRSHPTSQQPKPFYRTLADLACFMRRRERTIAFFGSARLVKSHTGRVTLCGGTVNDRRAAREWCSHFLHEAVVEVHRPNLHLHNSPTNITLSASTGERAG